MRTFYLRYIDDGLGVEQTIQFRALDAAAALNLAGRSKRGRVATLSEDGTAICRLERRATGRDSDVWVVGPVPEQV